MEQGRFRGQGNEAGVLHALDALFRGQGALHPFPREIVMAGGCGDGGDVAHQASARHVAHVGNQEGVELEVLDHLAQERFAVAVVVGHHDFLFREGRLPVPDVRGLRRGLVFVDQRIQQVPELPGFVRVDLGLRAVLVEQVAAHGADTDHVAFEVGPHPGSKHIVVRVRDRLGHLDIIGPGPAGVVQHNALVVQGGLVVEEVLGTGMGTEGNAVLDAIEVEGFHRARDEGVDVVLVPVPVNQVVQCQDDAVGCQLREGRDVHDPEQIRRISGRDARQHFLGNFVAGCQRELHHRAVVLGAEDRGRIVFEILHQCRLSDPQCLQHRGFRGTGLHVGTGIRQGTGCQQGSA